VHDGTGAAPPTGPAIRVIALVQLPQNPYYTARPHFPSMSLSYHRSALALASVVMLTLLLTASVVPSFAASRNPKITGYGLMNLHGKVVKTLKNGQQYFVYCILSNPTSKLQSFNVQFILDGSPFSGNGGGIAPHSSVVVPTGSLTAVTGSHNATIGLCTDSSCTAFLQHVTILFTVT